jgi:hypothetical protein
MKTNIMLESGDRELFGITIRQNTKEEFLSVTDLQKAYEKGKVINGWTGQTVNQLLLTEGVAEKCYGVLFEAYLINCDFSQFIENVRNTSLITVLKELKVYKVTGRGINKQVMAHPYIWMTIAMELNYVIYGKVVKWLADTLIFDRLDAGDKFKPMNSAISRLLEKPDYPKYATEINLRVFGEHKTGMRNKARAKELRLISEIENTVTKAIEHGWVKSEDDILKLIRTY